jgi:dTDP-4-amino-4,6-dideoxygalactose transaminase
MVPFVDIGKEFELFKNEIFSRIQKVLFNSQFILGEEVLKFESNISELFDTNYAVGLNSGTDALHFALLANGIGKGDKVITTPFSFIATTEAILYCGATPVFVDINPDTYNIDVEKIEEAIDGDTKAILIVHLFGNPCKMDKIVEITKKHNLILIEDCAQSLGSKYNDKFVGTFGKTGCFSFYPSKNLGAYGDGGMVVTNYHEIFKKFLLYRNHGLGADGYHNIIGFNSRLDSIQAAVLNVKLDYLNQFIEKRRKLAYIYMEYLKDVEEITFPKEEKNSFHTYNLLTIRAKKRDELKKFLNKNGINTGIYYKSTIPEQPAMRFLNVDNDSYFVASNISKQVLSLPLYPNLGEDIIKKITEKIKEFYAR